MKEKILTLLREMTNDSKSASFIAEKELCAILTLAINQLHAIEKKVGWCVREYPDKIKNIDDDGWYIELPKEINCNDGDFCFKIEWLDINLHDYFEKLKKRKISDIKSGIARVEYALSERKKDLQRLEELKFENINV